MTMHMFEVVSVEVLDAAYLRERAHECGDSGSRRKHFGKRGAGRFHCSPRGWHTRPMNALWLSLLFASPWLAAIAYAWSRAPRMDGPPPSMADRTRDRLWV